MMWEKSWRDQVWSSLAQPWDLVIIGGGITGAGILREATRAGLRALLVEAHDFAAGTSSRSSKLVHGGFRYLKNGQLKLTYQSVRERDRLLREGRGLVTPLGFLMASFKQDRFPAWVLGIGLTVYDLLALKWGHRYYDVAGMCELCPPLTQTGLVGGFRYFDAQTDDARLVLRVIREAVRQGGTAINYAQVEDLCFRRTGEVCGVSLRDLAPGGQERTTEIFAPVVINATGAWADRLRSRVGKYCPPRLRKLRGSHLVFPWSRFPLARAVSIWHPADQRPVFAFPWEGVTLVGTTDVDDGQELSIDPAISPAEVAYLLEAVTHTFPALQLGIQDVQSVFSGIRAVLDTGKPDPSKESREYVLWNENGLLTVTGGKLTTFRLMANEALQAARRRLPGHPRFDARLRMLDEPPADVFRDLSLNGTTRLGLLGRYGIDAPFLVSAAQPGEWEFIGDSQALWSELRWAARAEGVVHLEDLLLRRVRLGLLVPEGGIPLLDKIRAVTQPELGWDDLRWKQEAKDYTQLWKSCYSIN